MPKALPSYYYGDPMLAIDRIRAEAARKLKRKAERKQEPKMKRKS